MSIQHNVLLKSYCQQTLYTVAAPTRHCNTPPQTRIAMRFSHLNNIPGNNAWCQAQMCQSFWFPMLIRCEITVFSICRIPVPGALLEQVRKPLRIFGRSRILHLSSVMCDNVWCQTKTPLRSSSWCCIASKLPFSVYGRYAWVSTFAQGQYSNAALWWGKVYTFKNYYA